MKKIIAVLMILALVLTAVLPALAEKNGSGQGKPPQMNDRDHSGKENDRHGPGGKDSKNTPAKPDGKNPPEKPDGEQKNSAGESDGDQKDGKKNDSPRSGQNPLQKYVADGKLSQATYDAIQEYIKSNSGSADTSEDTQTPPEKTEGDEKKPPRGQPDAENLIPTQEMLDAMLKDGVITEDEYTVLQEAVKKPEDTSDTASSDTESSEEETVEDDTTQSA